MRFDPSNWFFVYVVTLYGLAVLGAATLGVVIATAMFFVYVVTLYGLATLGAATLGIVI